MLLWVITAVALLLAAAAWYRAGRLARKHEALNQSYWELRYDFTRLRSQVARLDPETAESDTPPEPPGSSSGAGQVTFVPLTSIKKKG